MSDFERKLREHYESQRLADARARAILAAGRAEASARAHRTRWWLGAAAALVVGLGLVSVTRFGGWTPPNEVRRILLHDAAGAVVSFFSQPGYQLPKVSANPAELQQWLREQGGPASFRIPKSMAALPSYGCHVLDVRGQRVYLICFFLDVSAVELTPGGMPIKKEIVVTAPDGTMMKKDRPLVHLVVAPRGAFRTVPKQGSRVQLPAAGAWNFQTWSEDDLVYLVAAAAPPERVEALAQAL